jgi:hypothetical protein
MNSDSDRPAVKALNDDTCVTSSQEGSKSRLWAGRSAEPSSTRASTRNSSRTASWNPTSAYCTRFVSVVPR